jgi:hypothetical protein
VLLARVTLGTYPGFSDADYRGTVDNRNIPTSEFERWRYCELLGVCCADIFADEGFCRGKPRRRGELLPARGGDDFGDPAQPERLGSGSVSKGYHNHVSQPPPLLSREPFARRIRGVLAFAGMLHRGTDRDSSRHARNVSHLPLPPPGTRNSYSTRNRADLTDAFATTMTCAALSASDRAKVHLNRTLAFPAMYMRSMHALASRIRLLRT